MKRFIQKTGHACRLLLNLFLAAVVIAGCGGGGSSDPIIGTSRLLLVSDVHFNPFYDPSLFNDLLTSPADRWAEVFRSSAITAPSPRGSETNYPLLDLALNATRREAAGSSLIIFPGDILGHGFRKDFFHLYGAEDEEALEVFAYKTIAFFVQEVRARFAGVPVIFALGNNDSYAGDYGLVVGGEFLADTASLFYEAFLLEGADPGEFYHTYSRGGYYVAEPPGASVLLVCLNTVLFSVRRVSAEPGGDEYAALLQLDWLEQILAEARVYNKKVWLIMHVPPGADIYSTVKNYMDDTGRISDAAFMWKAPYRGRFLDLAVRYRDVIEAGFAGHTHMDEYRLALGEGLNSRGMIIGSPSVTPLFGNDPAFKVLSMDFGDWELLNYRSAAFGLDGEASEFETLYDFSLAYARNGPLAQALASLYPDLSQDSALAHTYTGYYYSGRDSSDIITPVNWPAYWCAIAMMDPADYIECVNSY